MSKRKHPPVLNIQLVRVCGAITAAQAVKDYFIERTRTPATRQEKAGIKILSQFTELWKAENSVENDIRREFDTALQKHVTSVPEFDYFN